MVFEIAPPVAAAGLALHAGSCFQIGDVDGTVTAELRIGSPGPELGISPIRPTSVTKQFKAGTLVVAPKDRSGVPG
jgi:hypothetical protein